MTERDILPWIFGLVVFGVPAVAISVRIAARPILEGLARLKAASTPGTVVAAPDPRVDHLEAEVTGLRERLDHLSAVEDFYAQLQAGRAGGEARLPAGGDGTASH